MTALEVIRILQAMGWMLRDEGDHAVKICTPVLERYLALNPTPCLDCECTKCVPSTEPLKSLDAVNDALAATTFAATKRRGRPPKQK